MPIYNKFGNFMIDKVTAFSKNLILLRIRTLNNVNDVRDPIWIDLTIKLIE